MEVGSRSREVGAERGREVRNDESERGIGVAQAIYAEA